jgi:hypothetical protein
MIMQDHKIDLRAAEHDAQRENVALPVLCFVSIFAFAVGFLVADITSDRRHAEEIASINQRIKDVTADIRRTCFLAWGTKTGERPQPQATGN